MIVVFLIGVDSGKQRWFYLDINLDSDADYCSDSCAALVDVLWPTSTTYFVLRIFRGVPMAAAHHVSV